ncbi:MAG: hypothetical protein QXV42_01620 [Ignisphaera sp.]
MNKDKRLLELEEKCVEKASKVVDDILRDFENPETNLDEILSRFRHELFGRYPDHAYYNFGNPILSSLMVNPSGVLVKILPVKDEEKFKEIYGISTEEMLKLIKDGLVIPVIDEKIAYFSKSNDNIIEIVEKSVENNMILNYYYEELFRRIAPKYYEETEKKLNMAIDNICMHVERIRWDQSLVVSKKIACEEFKYNTFITLLQYNVASPAMEEHILRKLFNKNIIDAIDFMFYNSTFMTDPIFYSPNGSIIADISDLKYGILKLVNINENIPSDVINRLDTFIYRGLLMEIGATIIGNQYKKELSILIEVKKLEELYDDVRKSLRRFNEEKNKLMNYIFSSLKNRYLNLTEFTSIIDDFINKVSEEYRSISDKRKRGKKYLRISLTTFGIATTCIYLIASRLHNVELIVRNIPGFIGTLSNLLNIIEIPITLKSISSYLMQLKNIDVKSIDSKVNSQMEKIYKFWRKIPNIGVIDVSNK